MSEDRFLRPFRAEAVFGARRKVSLQDGIQTMADWVGTMAREKAAFSKISRSQNLAAELAA